MELSLTFNHHHRCGDEKKKKEDELFLKDVNDFCNWFKLKKWYISNSEPRTIQIRGFKDEEDAAMKMNYILDMQQTRTTTNLPNVDQMLYSLVIKKRRVSI